MYTLADLKRLCKVHGSFREINSTCFYSGTPTIFSFKKLECKFLKGYQEAPCNNLCILYKQKGC